jgi:hypothetical protein
MRTKSLKYLLAVFVLMVAIAPVFAKGVSKNVTITSDHKIAGKELKAGDTYTFNVDETKLTVEKNKKVVAEATGRWEQRTEKSEGDTFVTGANGQIQEIQFAGEKRAFVISGQ